MIFAGKHSIISAQVGISINPAERGRPEAPAFAGDQ